jgi:ferredoxin
LVLIYKVKITPTLKGEIILDKKKIIYTIYDSCIACGKCAKNCPVNAIEFKEDLFRYNIDKEKCISCGKCYNGCVYDSITKICSEEKKLLLRKSKHSRK